MLAATKYPENKPFSAIAGAGAGKVVPQNLVIQRKLTVGKDDDEFEKEADSTADRVMRMPGQGFVQRKCAHCEEEEKINRKPLSSSITPFIQTKSESGAAVSQNVSGSIESSRGGGSSLDGQTQSFMASRMGSNFGQVKIHADDQSAQLNRSLNPKAFTVGNDIYFNEGQYKPQSSEGKRLLAHEMTHVMQQSATIRRQPAPADALEKEAVKLETEIMAHAKMSGSGATALKAESKARVLRIIAKAKTKPVGTSTGQRNYYLTKLKDAISTPFNGTETGNAEYGCSKEAEDANRKNVEKALDIEKAWGSIYNDVEEKAVATGTSKVKKKGEQGKFFHVDKTDPRNIRVLIKVKLNGKADEVASIKKLEDAIERSSHTKGYYLDIVFVDTTGEDVFEFSVIFCQWANSGNWASAPVTLSHEVHHALGLGDRYDYIESHSKNRQMNVPMRLKWFEEQMNKTGGPRDQYSKMSTSSNQLLSEDICTVAFESAADQRKCIDARKDLDPAGIPPI